MPEQEIETDIVVVGAGGCGLTAALAGAERGARVLLLESDSHPGGSTSMSAGLFVAAGSALQRANGETGTAAELAEDILRLNAGQSDPVVTQALCEASGPLTDWMAGQGVPLEHMAGYRYAGMSRSWLHSTPQRAGSEIVAPLVARVHHAPHVKLQLGTAVTGLISSNGEVSGVTARSTDGAAIQITARAVVLAAAGFGANRDMVAEYLPGIAGMPYYGALNASGAAIRWGRALGAPLDHMSAYQSHSSIAHPEPMLVTTYLINFGAIQVNQQGRRFGDETDAYAGHAGAVQRQPGKAVVEVFDGGILRRTMSNYPRVQECVEAGIVQRAETAGELDRQFDLDSEQLSATLSKYNGAVALGADEFGRTRFGEPLRPPYFGVRVTSALVQTLGGLRVDAKARVQGPQGKPIPGLYAGGGTAAGLAGDSPEGYLAGTGLLAAFGLGWIAGRQAGSA